MTDIMAARSAAFRGRILNRQARKAVNGIAVIVIAYVLLAGVFNILYLYSFPYIEMFVVSVTDFIFDCGRIEAKIMAENLFNSLMYNEFLGIISNVLCTFLPAVFLSKLLLGMSFDKSAPMDGKLMRGTIPIFAASQFMAVAVSEFVVIFGSAVFPALFNAENSGGYAGVTGGVVTFGILDLVVYFLSLCVITPFIEEYVFRGIAFGALRKFGYNFAALTNSVIFGLVHGSIPQFVYALVFGLALSAVYEKTGNLKSCIILHALNNTYSFVVVDLIPYFTDEYVSDIVVFALDFIFAMLALYGMILIFSSKNNICADTCSDSEKVLPSFKCFFTVGTMLIIAIFLSYVLRPVL